MDELDISARELRTLLRISNRASPAKEHGEGLDDLIAAVHALLPFTHCVVLHERLQQSHTLAFAYQRASGFSKRIGVTQLGDQPLRIAHYLRSFSRFGTFQNAFFWFHKTAGTLVDRGVANALSHATLTEGIAGGVNIFDSACRGSATLVQLQYPQEQFVAKHLVFANLIASHLHDYFEQGETVSRTPLAANNRASTDSTWLVSTVGRAH